MSPDMACLPNDVMVSLLKTGDQSIGVIRIFVSIVTILIRVYQVCCYVTSTSRLRRSNIKPKAETVIIFNLVIVRVGLLQRRIEELFNIFIHSNTCYTIHK